MTTATTSSQANDFRGFLPSKSNPERPFCGTRRVPRQPFRELNPVGRLAIETEPTETGTASYCSKEESARTKVKPVQSASADDQGHKGGTAGITCANQSSPFGSTRVNSSCVVEGCNCSSADVLVLFGSNQRNLEEDRATTAQNSRREMVKRSVSAVGELTGRIGQSTQSTVHASCISGQRLAEWKAPSRYDDVRDEFIVKRMSLVEQSSRTPSGKIHTESRNVPESPTREHPPCTVLGGPGYVGQEVKTPTDRCPLLENDRSMSSYDNAATAENSIGGIRPHPGKSSLGTTAVRSLSSAADPLPISARVDGESASPQPRPLVDAKKKKWFTALRIRIPENDEGGVGPKLNLKKLSAADERKIEAALELAGTFSRLGTSDHCPSTPRTPTPRTPGAASRASKESLASNNSNNSDSSPTSSSSSSSHFRFNFSKARKENHRKSSADAHLASRLTADPDGLLTPEALEAYDRLVANRWDGGNESLSSAAKRTNRLPKQTTTTTHRSSLRTTVLGRISYRTKNCLSESDKDGVPVAEEESANPAKTGSDGAPKRRGTTGRGRRHRTLTEPNPFSWFDRNPLNKARSEQRQQKGRPDSFHFETGCAAVAGLSPYPLSMPAALDPGCQLPPRTGRAARNSEGAIRRPPPPPPPSPPPPPPCTGEESDSPPPPPAIPPRIPHRHSAVATRSKVHHRGNHPTKPRSYSDSDHAVSSSAAQSARSPAAGSTETGDSLSPSPSPVHRSLDGSNDCVFVYGGHVPRSPPLPPPPPPPVRRPLGPATGGSARGPKGGGFGVAPCRSTSVRDVKAKELGPSNKNDPLLFREKKSVAPDLLTECHSETDLLREAHTPIPGCYETSDSISYEDLMEFALDGPRYEDRVNALDSTVCDEIRLMRKMFSNEVSVEDCMEALVETGWNINYAVKLVKLKQLLGSGLGTQDQCKDALMASNWNVGEAAASLLPPANR